MPHPRSQLVVLPDTDDELVALLDWLEEVCGLLAAFEEDDAGLLPLPLAGGRALRSLRTVRRLVATAEQNPPAQPVAADGRRELVPLLFVTVEAQHLSAALAAISTLTTTTDPTILAVTRELNDRLVNPLAALQRLGAWLAIPANRDAEALSVLLAAGHGRVVLDRIDEAAYWRVADRVRCTLWSPGDPLSWFVFRCR